MELRARNAVGEFFAGRHRGLRAGTSLDFAEHRDYSAGDDLRRVDWKTYARRDRLYVKHYEADVRLTCWVFLDVSRSMYFGDKLRFACDVTAALAFLTLQQRDAFGWGLFAGTECEFFSASSEGAAFVRLLDRLSSGTPALTDRALAETDSGKSGLFRLADQLPHAGVAVVLTDGWSDIDNSVSSVSRLSFSRHDVRLIQIVDPLEADFPYHGPTTFVGLEDSAIVTAEAEDLRAAYLTEYAQYCRELETRCRQAGASYHQLMTTQQLVDALHIVTESPRSQVEALNK